MYAVQHGAGEGRSYLMEHNAILDSKLSLSSNIPLYAQLVGIIKREISSGALKIGADRHPLKKCQRLSGNGLENSHSQHIEGEIGRASCRERV